MTVHPVQNSMTSVQHPKWPSIPNPHTQPAGILPLAASKLLELEYWNKLEEERNKKQTLIRFPCVSS